MAAKHVARPSTLAPYTGSSPAHVVVVGAGVVGLSTAWFLQEHGVRVTVLDRSEPAAGSSWGNAGWVSPGMAIPLSEPSVLKYGIKALFDPDSPLFLPLKADPTMLGFMLGFASRCTMPQWRKSMAHFVPLNRRAFEGYDELTAGGVDSKVNTAPLLAAFLSREDASTLEHEFDLVREAGLDLEADPISGDELRRALPMVSDRVSTGINIKGQRYINPGEFVAALASSVTARGGEVVSGAEASRLRHGPGGIRVDITGREPIHGDAVVLATGAWLPTLARDFGVRTTLVGGRGYSFSVPVENPPVSGPIYFPTQRVACTPIGDRLRIGGTMEFRGPDERLFPQRVEAIIRSAEPLLSGVDFSARRDVWVGARPVTVDNLPLVGPTAAPGVWTAGGHGMWGITLGPITGKLLAEQMVTGTTPPELRPLAPTR